MGSEMNEKKNKNSMKINIPYQRLTAYKTQTANYLPMAR